MDATIKAQIDEFLALFEAKVAEMGVPEEEVKRVLLEVIGQMADEHMAKLIAVDEVVANLTNVLG